MEELGAQERPLVILFRDEHLLAVDKPSGLVVHRGWAKDEVVVMSLARDAIGQHVYPVHRLDRGTSGVLLFALDPETARLVQAQFTEHSIEKRYRALVRGALAADQEIDHPIPRSEGGPRVEAQTRVRPIYTKDRYTWVEAIPRTGRLHQVRRHLKHISHPIIGDVQYGKGEHNRYFRERYQLHRITLHSVELRFVHPYTSEALSLIAPLPKDLSDPLAAWGLEPSLEIAG